MKIYEALGDAFLAEEVADVFVVMGDGNMSWLADLHKKQVNVWHARHEAGAVAMADGYARSSGAVGVCSTTQGPGLTNATTSLAVAAAHRTPLVLLTGDLPQERGPDRSGQLYQRVEQRNLVESVGGLYQVVRHPNNAAVDVELAFRMAREHRAPVVLSVPVDVMRQEAPDSWRYVRSTNSGPIDRPHGGPELIQLAHLLEDARLPAFIAGNGAIEDGAADKIRTLADMCGALLATTLPARGLFDGHRHAVGIAGGYASPKARAMFAASDLVVLFGSSGSGHTLDWGRLAPSATVVQVDLASLRIGDTTVLPDLHVRCDAHIAATALIDALTLTATERMGGYGDLLAAWEASPSASLPPAVEVMPMEIDPHDLMTRLNSAIPPETSFVIGIGHFWWFALEHLTGRSPTHFIYSYDFGCIGQALPTAIGVALSARPQQPVVVIEGDVSLMMNVQEIESMVRFNTPILLVVMNDGASGAEVHRINAEGWDGEIATFGRPAFASVAHGFGAESFEVTNIEDLPAALESWIAQPRPMVIDAHISRAVINPIIVQYLDDARN